MDPPTLTTPNDPQVTLGGTLKTVPHCDQTPVVNELARGINNTTSVVGNGPRRREQSGVLRDIKYTEGVIKTFPARLKQSMQDFLDVNLDVSLSCAQSEWRPDTGLQRTPNGDVRQWFTYPEGEPLQMGRFRYGVDQKILIAQAFPGSKWHMAEPRIIVHAGGGNNNFKVWGGQRVLDTIPNESGVVRWSKVEEDTEDEDKLGDSDTTLEPGSGFRKLRSSLGVRQLRALQDTALVTTESSDSSSIGVPPRPASSAGLRLTSSAETKARNARSLSPIKNTKRRRSGGRNGSHGQTQAPKAKKVRTGRYSSGRGNMEDHPFEVCIVNDMQHPESVVPRLANELSRMGRQGGLPRHLQLAGNKFMAEPVATVEEVPIPPTVSAQSLERAGNVNPSIPIRQSPSCRPALGSQSLSTDSPTRKPER